MKRETPSPIPLAKVSAKWLATKRKCVVDFGYALRADAGTGIEFKSHREDNAWLPLPLPRGATCFESAADRDAILAKLQGVQ